MGARTAETDRKGWLEMGTGDAGWRENKEPLEERGRTSGRGWTRCGVDAAGPLRERRAQGRRPADHRGVARRRRRALLGPPPPPDAGDAGRTWERESHGPWVLDLCAGRASRSLRWRTRARGSVGSPGDADGFSPSLELLLKIQSKLLARSMGIARELYSPSNHLNICRTAVPLGLLCHPAVLAGVCLSIFFCMQLPPHASSTHVGCVQR